MLLLNWSWSWSWSCSFGLGLSLGLNILVLFPSLLMYVVIGETSTGCFLPLVLSLLFFPPYGENIITRTSELWMWNYAAYRIQRANDATRAGRASGQPVEAEWQTLLHTQKRAAGEHRGRYLQSKPSYHISDSANRRVGLFT